MVVCSQVYFGDIKDLKKWPTSPSEKRLESEVTSAEEVGPFPFW
jgi:hypothetical protein